MDKQRPIKIIKKNSPEGSHKDLYHHFLRTSWTKLFLIYIFLYLSINLLFAFLYLVDSGSITASAHNIKNAFFFSVQTFSTVGYGTIAPQNLYGNIIVVLEIMTGVMFLALTTGLVFAKFSKPSAKILYSKSLLITKFDSKNVLMFRIANARSNQIISAKVELHYTYPTISPEGLHIVRFAQLKLQKSYSPLFSLSWSVFHTIDSESPFYEKSEAEIKKLNYEFYVLFNGTDGTFSQTIHDMHNYTTQDILVNHRFVDILHRQVDGTRIIDYDKFDQTTPHD